jgi:hypothetical protein
MRVDVDRALNSSRDIELQLLLGVTNSGSRTSSSEVRSMVHLPAAIWITLDGRRRPLAELVAWISLPGSSLMVIPGSDLTSGAPWK